MGRADGSGSQPNIVFILADDLGWGELNCYGNDFNETPNIDRLASQGIRFTQAYTAAPVCSPTRGSIMTGQYPARNGIMDFLGPNDDHYLDPSKFVTINEMLGKAGYHTGLIGKWHLDTTFDRIPAGPKAQGFDEVIATETKYIADGDYFYPYDKVETLTGGKDGDFLTDQLVNEAIDYIKRNKSEEQPFFLYLSHFSVHTALDAPPDLVDKYVRKYEDRHGKGSAAPFSRPRNKAHLGKIDNPYLAAMLEKMDDGVGRIMQTLDELDLAEKTIVVFMSDNGGDGRVANNGGLRRDKTWVWEGGIRVPQIIRWTGTVPAGKTCDVPTTTVDYYPTFAELAHTELPEDEVIDGVSLLPILTDPQASLGRDVLYWHYPADTAPWPERAAGAVRDGDLKLIQIYTDGHVELFDLKKDPNEPTNLAEERPEETKRLYKMLDDWRHGLGVEIPEAARTGTP